MISITVIIIAVILAAVWYYLKLSQTEPPRTADEAPPRTADEAPPRTADEAPRTEDVAPRTEKWIRKRVIHRLLGPRFGARIITSDRYMFVKHFRNASTQYFECYSKRRQNCPVKAKIRFRERAVFYVSAREHTHTPETI